MKLFLKPGACSMAAHIILEETGATYTTEKVDLPTKTTESGQDYRTINPRGAVPALQLQDGTTITQNAAILQYLGDISDIAALKPAQGSIERIRLQEALGFCSDLHSAVGGFFAPNLDEAGRARQTVAATRRFTELEAMLPAQGYWLGEFTQADAYVFTVAAWTKIVGFDLTPYAKVQALIALVAARPSTQAMLKAEGLI